MNQITRGCVRCHNLFQYGDLTKSLRGQMTRKYCDNCIILNHRDESRIYSKEYRKNNRENINRKARIRYRSELQKL